MTSTLSRFLQEDSHFLVKEETESQAEGAFLLCRICLAMYHENSRSEGVSAALPSPCRETLNGDGLKWPRTNYFLKLPYGFFAVVVFLNGKKISSCVFRKHKYYSLRVTFSGLV
jgi:hypothetical protein